MGGSETRESAQVVWEGGRRVMGGSEHGNYGREGDKGIMGERGTRELWEEDEGIMGGRERRE